MSFARTAIVRAFLQPHFLFSASPTSVGVLLFAKNIAGTVNSYLPVSKLRVN